MPKLILPKEAGFYKAKVQGAWEPVSFFKFSKKDFGVILIGQQKELKGKKIDENISEFGDKIEFPE